MEETGVTMSQWNKLFSLAEISRPHLLPPLVLAYIGDAVYELSVRAHIIAGGITRTDRLHAGAVRYVCAETQSAVLQSLEGMLTEEEASVARRGRNAKSAHTPKGASVIAYRRSTGLECLVGYLFLKGDQDRLADIMEKVFYLIEKNET
jgi:ribonuclease-3 family protein